MAFWYLKGACEKDGGKLFSRTFCKRVRDNGSKWKKGRFRLDIRKNCFFMMRVMKHSGYCSGCSSLETFRVRLGRTLSKLI